MGCVNFKEERTIKSNNPNAKKLSLHADICSSWEFDSSKDQLIGLIKQLNLKGFDVDYVAEPKLGFGGEFYVYVVEDKKKTVVFSNNPDKHKDCEIGYGINMKNIPKIIERIEELMKWYYKYKDVKVIFLTIENYCDEEDANFFPPSDSIFYLWKIYLILIIFSIEFWYKISFN